MPAIFMYPYGFGGFNKLFGDNARGACARVLFGKIITIIKPLYTKV